MMSMIMKSITQRENKNPQPAWIRADVIDGDLYTCNHRMVGIVTSQTTSRAPLRNNFL